MAARPQVRGWRHRGSGALSPRALQTAQRDRDAVALRMQGLTFDQISARLGYGHRSSARKAVERGLDFFRPESNSDLRLLEYVILETLEAALWKPFLDDQPISLKAVDLLLAVSDRRYLLTAGFTVGFDSDTAGWSYETTLEQSTPSGGGPWTDFLAARAANMTFDEIAKRFDLRNRAAARRRVDADVRNYARGIADVYLAQMLRNLDELHQAHWAAATANPPDHKAIRVILRIHDQRAKLLHLYPPPAQQAPRRTTRQPR